MEEQESNPDSFVWDQISQLYYHPSTGFYHDPNAGWYYSSKDGLYYKFEDGNYVLLNDSHKGDQSEFQGEGQSSLCENAMYEQDRGQNNDENQGGSDQVDFSNHIATDMPENHPPPSEWLEDTLIELYLSGYPNSASNAASEHAPSQQTDERDNSLLPVEASWEEENWRAQYGQVVQEEAEHSTDFQIVDIWEWSMVKEIQEEGGHQVARLVGRLVKPSCKLHPSMPSRGGRLRTGPICKTHLDLVQVRSGQVYKLRSPNAKYLATLSSYDASNPTKEWGFPDFSVTSIKQTCASKDVHQTLSQKNTSLLTNDVGYKKRSTAYRDRASERRALHGGFGVGPGQKKSVDDVSADSSPISVYAEDAAAEALEMSFGSDSYAQKILKNMGWKEGEALGKTQQGLKQPLLSVGNKGTAGLGWKT